MYTFADTKDSKDDKKLSSFESVSSKQEGTDNGRGREDPNPNGAILYISLFAYNHTFHSDEYSTRKLRSRINGGPQVPPTIPKEDLKGKKENKKRMRAMKELDELKVDNAGRVEADRTLVRRKIQVFLSRNDDITSE